MSPPAGIHENSWVDILKSAYRLFDELDQRGFGAPPFSLGGGTVLMFRLKHRLSRDIDLFSYDAQWLSLLSPRLNESAASLAIDYVEQANTVKIVTGGGDIDFIIAADVIRPAVRTMERLAGRDIAVDPTNEILAKKLLYRAATFQPRDVYDLSAAIDLNPNAAREALAASHTKRSVLLSRLTALKALPSDELLGAIVPYPDAADHGRDMVDKVIAFTRAGR